MDIYLDHGTGETRGSFNVLKCGVSKVKIYKKNISIETGNCWKSVYYTFEDGEVWFIKKYSKRFTNKEIKDDVFPEIKEHFE